MSKTIPRSAQKRASPGSSAIPPISDRRGCAAEDQVHDLGEGCGEGGAPTRSWFRPAQQSHEGVEIVARGHRVEDEVGGFPIAPSSAPCPWNHHIFGAELAGVLALPGDVVNATTWRAHALAS